jgi:hypothetical protein
VAPNRPAPMIGPNNHLRMSRCSSDRSPADRYFAFICAELNNIETGPGDFRHYSSPQG